MREDFAEFPLPRSRLESLRARRSRSERSGCDELHAFSTGAANICAAARVSPRDVEMIDDFALCG
jgi:hypothetical protein